MGKEGSVESFLDTMAAPRARRVRSAHLVFVAQGCSTYVKTIYIGYDFDGVMVGALYPRENHLEIALALPEDHPSPLLIDAGHLTWRTLPVAAVISSESQIPDLEVLVAEAVVAVRQGRHTVYRDNEYFAKRRGDTSR